MPVILPATLLVLSVATFNLIECCDRLYTAVQLVHRQLDFFENTIRLCRTCDVEVTAFLDKKGQVGTQETQSKNAVLKNLEAIKSNLNNLIRKKNLVVENLLKVLYGNESGIRPDEMQKIKENLVTQMMDIKELAFRQMLNGSVELGQVMCSNLTKDDGMKMLDPAKKDYDENIAKLSQYLGLPVNLKSFTSN